MRAQNETPEQVRARRGFALNHLLAQGTGLAVSLKHGHDTMSEAELAAYCDDDIPAQVDATTLYWVNHWGGGDVCALAKPAPSAATTTPLGAPA